MNITGCQNHTVPLDSGRSTNPDCANSGLEHHEGHGDRLYFVRDVGSNSSFGHKNPG
jgi:hypothetical protein